VATPALPSDASSTRTPVCVPGTRRAAYPLDGTSEPAKLGPAVDDNAAETAYGRTWVMGRRGTLAVGCAIALAVLLAPCGLAARTVSVGYESPSALRGLDVVSTIPSLHVAEVVATDVATLRGRPGIQWIRSTVRRRHLGGSLVALRRGAAAAEWQYTATRANLVPADVQRAASAITIAVVDTGADLGAPTIAAKAPTTYNAVTSSDAVSDVTGHGTFVASVAGGSVTAGSALHGFGGDARLMIVQANRGSDVFDDVDEAAGIVWAVNHGARIVNLSIGGAQTSQVEQDAIVYALSHGVLLVAAAGNTGLGGNVESYPAALVGPHGLAVASSTAAGRRAPFSTAAKYVSLAAPGVHVLGATTAGASTAEFPRATFASDGLYAYGTGTSYSAPQVAGAAALVWAADPTLTPTGVITILEQTASGHRAWNPGTGYGVLDVAAAVVRALAAKR
jgi:subtilisin family serine protease